MTELAAGHAAGQAEQQADMQAVAGRAAGRIDRATGLFGAIEEADILRKLQESGHIDGFYDQDNNLIPARDSGVILSMSQRDHLILMLRNRVTLSEILLIEATARLRRQAKIAPDATYQGKLTVSCPTEPVYYGHSFVLILQLENTGQAPLFDGLILDGLPAHCRFLRFGVSPDKAVGYVPAYLEAQQLIAVRLVRPLQPGEKFRIALVCQADPWLLN
jgi:hypothetical protein